MIVDDPDATASAGGSARRAGLANTTGPGDHGPAQRIGRDPVFRGLALVLGQKLLDLAAIDFGGDDLPDSMYGIAVGLSKGMC